MTLPAQSKPESGPLEPVANADSKGAAEGLARARDNFGRGQVLAARQIMLSLFGSKSGEVSNQTLMLELGRTYDPWYLGQLPKSDVSADPMQAQYYYEEAKLLGSVDASTDLQRILGRAASNRPNSSDDGTDPRPELERKSPAETGIGVR